MQTIPRPKGYVEKPYIGRDGKDYHSIKDLQEADERYDARRTFTSKPEHPLIRPFAKIEHKPKNLYKQMQTIPRPANSERYKILKYIGRDGIHYDTWKELKEANRREDERIEKRMREKEPISHMELRELPGESNIRHFKYVEVLEKFLRYLHVR